MALVTSENILSYIPQKPPIVMVSELASHSQEQTVSRLKLSPDNMFCHNGVFTEPGLIENIAQTGALRMGYVSSQQSDDGEPPVGFIGAVAKLKIHKLPAHDSTLETTIDVLNDIFGITLVKGTIRVNDEVVAECEMKIVIPNQA